MEKMEVTPGEAGSAVDDSGLGDSAAELADISAPHHGSDSRLTELEEQILELERGWWKVAPTKEQAIREAFAMPPTRYYLLLSNLLDDERAWRADPALVDRLRRLRDRRMAERAQLEE